MEIKENPGIVLSCERWNKFSITDLRNVQMYQVKGLGQAQKWKILLFVRGTLVACGAPQAIAETLKTLQA